VWLHRALAVEHARKLRLSEALRDVDGHDRAEVVRACADLEAAIGDGNDRSTLVRERRGLSQGLMTPAMADH
jgi:hypothetical protein